MVNLIPYNPTAASGGFQAPKHQRVERPLEGEFGVDSGGHFELGKWQFSQNYDDSSIIDDLIFLSLSCKPLPFQTMGSKLS